MIDLEIDKQNQLQFQVDIAGDNSKNEPRIDFRIVSEGLSLSFPAVRNGNNHEVTIPMLEGLLKPGTYKAEISVILGDRYFVPLTEEVVLNPKIEPKVNAVAVKGIDVRPKITVEAVQTAPEIKPIVEVHEPIVFKRKEIVKDK